MPKYVYDFPAGSVLSLKHGADNIVCIIFGKYSDGRVTFIITKVFGNKSKILSEHTIPSNHDDLETEYRNNYRQMYGYSGVELLTTTREDAGTYDYYEVVQVLRYGWDTWYTYYLIDDPQDTYFEDMSELKLAQEISPNIIKVTNATRRTILTPGTIFLNVLTDCCYLDMIDKSGNRAIVVELSNHLYTDKILQYDTYDKFYNKFVVGNLDLELLFKTNPQNCLELLKKYTYNINIDDLIVNRIIVLREGWDNEPPDTYFEDMSELKLASVPNTIEITQDNAASILTPGTVFLNIDDDVCFVNIMINDDKFANLEDVPLSQISNISTYDDCYNWCIRGDESLEQAIQDYASAKSADLDIYSTKNVILSEVLVLRTGWPNEESKDTYFEDMSELKLSQQHVSTNKQNLGVKLSQESTDSASLLGVELPEGSLFITEDNIVRLNLYRTGIGLPRMAQVCPGLMPLANVTTNLISAQSLDAALRVLLESVGYTNRRISNLITKYGNLKDGFIALCNAGNRQILQYITFRSTLPSTITSLRNRRLEYPHDLRHIFVLDVIRRGWPQEPPDTYFEDMSELKLASGDYGSMFDLPEGSIFVKEGSGSPELLLRKTSDGIDILYLPFGNYISTVIAALESLPVGVVDPYKIATLLNNAGVKYCRRPLDASIITEFLYTYNTGTFSNSKVANVIRFGPFVKDTYFEDMSELKLASIPSTIRLTQDNVASILTPGTIFINVVSTSRGNQGFIDLVLTPTTITSLLELSSSELSSIKPCTLKTIYDLYTPRSEELKTQFNAKSVEDIDSYIPISLKYIAPTNIVILRNGWPNEEPPDTYFEDMSELKLAETTDYEEQRYKAIFREMRNALIKWHDTRARVRYIYYKNGVADQMVKLKIDLLTDILANKWQNKVLLKDNNLERLRRELMEFWYSRYSRRESEYQTRFDFD